MISCFVCINCAKVLNREVTEQHYWQCFENRQEVLHQYHLIRTYGIDHRNNDLVVPRLGAVSLLGKAPG